MELILAIALMGIIILGVTSFDLGSRQFLQSSERKTKVLNEATLILDRVTKDALIGIGTVNSRALITGEFDVLTNPTYIRIIPDTNGNGIYETGVDDRWIRYRYINLAPNLNTIERVRRDPPGTGDTIEYLSRRAINLNAVRVGTTNTVQLILTLRFDPTRPQNAFDNPEVVVQTTAEVPGWSLN